MNEIAELRYRQGIILSALKNILSQNNPNGVNDYLLKIISREI